MDYVEEEIQERVKGCIVSEESKFVMVLVIQ